MPNHGQWRPFIKKLRAEGWVVAQTKKGHTKATHPSGASFVFSRTSGDWRAYRSALADKRRIERHAHEHTNVS